MVFCVFMTVLIVIFIRLDRRIHHFEIQLKRHQSDIIIYFCFLFNVILWSTDIMVQWYFTRYQDTRRYFTIISSIVVCINEAIIICFKNNKDILQSFSQLDEYTKVSYVFYEKDAHSSINTQPSRFSSCHQVICN